MKPVLIVEVNEKIDYVSEKKLLQKKKPPFE
jgi:hypothetical protein